MDLELLQKLSHTPLRLKEAAYGELEVELNCFQVQMTVANIFFVHQRGLINTIYIRVISISQQSALVSSQLSKQSSEKGGETALATAFAATESRNDRLSILPSRGVLSGSS